MSYPMTRQRTFDPPDELFDDPAPVRPLTFADGHQGWLVTGHAAGRAVLADPRFSNNPRRMHPLLASRRLPEGEVPPGFFLRMDAPDHTHYRRLLTGQFTVRRMNLLKSRIEEIAADCLDDMERQGPPTDLVRSFALPIPSLVICELLGVPYEDREQFQRDSSRLLRLESSPEELAATVGDLIKYVYTLIERKRAEPGNDMLTGLIGGGELNDDEIAGMGFLLLVAGHETTANMLGLGTFALLQNPEQLALVRDDPSVIDNAVEELLRYLSIIHFGPMRTATEDVTVDGTLIRAGDCVALSIPAANRDPGRFPDPAVLDVRRPASGHLTFGHGIHQCLGQQLARIEMRVAYPALLRRFPTLRLAVPAEEVPMRTDMSIYGVHSLRVAW
ncbi:cytochrome P450 [Nonomuraea sp. NPDC059194]|uniref:cytochrome P450 n=1 Tax=Nonomuraea sp. NPDC059194 TaxID=3346764 RepID=UPI0036A2120D